jgi:hypothetical protein
MKAHLLLKEKLTDSDGDLLERVIWQVPQNRLYRDGIRYRLAFIPLGASTPVVLYDNHHPKGHHKHLETLEQPYFYSTVAQLRVDFENDVRIWKDIRRNSL